MPTLIEEASIGTSRFSLEQTVPRSLVHKRSIENVLLTDIQRRESDQFVGVGRVPTAHRFFNQAGRKPRKDILFYTELGRQASLAVSHMFMGVGREDVFIFEGSQASMAETVATSDRPWASDSVVTEIRVQETETRKNNAVSRVVAEQIMSVNGEPVFHGIGAWTIQPAALFQRLRRLSKTHTSPADSTSPATGDLSGEWSNADRENAVIFIPKSNPERSEFSTRLIVDESDPYFFDHPCDHVPGMLILEGCSQLAKAAVGVIHDVDPRKLAVVAYEMNFQQFVECDRPIGLTARVERNSNQPAPIRVQISITQQNVVSGTSTMTVAC